MCHCLFGFWCVCLFVILRKISFYFWKKALWIRWHIIELSFVELNTLFLCHNIDVLIEYALCFNSCSLFSMDNFHTQFYTHFHRYFSNLLFARLIHQLDVWTRSQDQSVVHINVVLIILPCFCYVKWRCSIKVRCNCRSQMFHRYRRCCCKYEKIWETEWEREREGGWIIKFYV